MGPTLPIQRPRNCLYRKTRTTAWRPMLSRETTCLYQALIPTYHISVHRYSLVRVNLIKLASNMGVRFQLCQPQNAIHFLPHGKRLFNWYKTGRNSTTAARMRVENDIYRAGKGTGRVTILIELVQNLVSAFISEIYCFYYCMKFTSRIEKTDSS
jgi:hypothetical protein